MGVFRGVAAPLVVGAVGAGSAVAAAAIVEQGSADGGPSVVVARVAGLGSCGVCGEHCGGPAEESSRDLTEAEPREPRKPAEVSSDESL